jgi:hypothetical protein
MLSGNSQDGLIERLLDFFWQMASVKKYNNFESDKDDFVFHMTDWASDLENMARLYSAPNRFSQEEAAQILQSFLYHAVPHIVAAAEIYDDAPEILRMLSKAKEPSEAT